MIGDFILNLINERGESVRSLSIDIGVSRAALKKWIDNETSPSIKNAKALADHYEEKIDLFLSDDRKLEYQFMAAGDAAIAEATAHMQPRVSLENSIEQITKTSSESHLCIPILAETNAGCGNGCINDGWMLPSEFMWLDRDWLQQTARVNNDNLVIIRAQGDSMEPTILTDDLILVSTINIDTARMPDGIYVIQRGDYTYTKRLQRTSEGLKIISDNPHYETEMVTDDVDICGRVVWIWNGRRV